MKFTGATLPDKNHPYRGNLDLYVRNGEVVARQWPIKAPYNRQAMLRQKEREAKQHEGETKT